MSGIKISVSNELKLARELLDGSFSNLSARGDQLPIRFGHKEKPDAQLVVTALQIMEVIRKLAETEYKINPSNPQESEKPKSMIFEVIDASKNTDK